MLIITTLALLMAATMGWMALRLLRDEQRRSEARVAALTAALDAPWPAAEPVGPPPPLVHAPVAPQAQVTRQIVTLDDTSPHEYFASAETTTRGHAAGDEAPWMDAVHDEATRPMFGAQAAEAESAPTDDRRWLALGIAAFVVLGVAGAWWSTARSGPDATPATSTRETRTAAAPAGGVPVELVSLGHERTAQGLVIRGLVRNPAAASTRTGTVASIFLFDEAGGFLGSGRSVLDTPTLTAGDEAGFEVTLPGNDKVRRYRVTFRATDGTVVPHLDKRPVSGVTP